MDDRYHGVGFCNDGTEHGVGFVLLLVTQQGVAACKLTVLVEAFGVVPSRLGLEALGMTFYVGTRHVGGIEQSVSEDLVLCHINPTGISAL